MNESQDLSMTVITNCASKGQLEMGSKLKLFKHWAPCYRAWLARIAALRDRLLTLHSNKFIASDNTDASHVTGISPSFCFVLSLSLYICAFYSLSRFSFPFSSQPRQTVALQCNKKCNLIVRWHESRWRKPFHITALIKTITPTPTASQRCLCAYILVWFWE